ncbi:MAG: hypothetical protein ACYTGQ_16975, partial [Planctomycetota bacterium]
MPRLVLILALSGVLLCGGLLDANAQLAISDEAVTDHEIRRAIDLLVGALYGAQNQAGLWDSPVPDLEDRAARNHGGLTALATYALLTAGQSYQDPRLRPAIEFLRRVNMTGTYARSLRAHVWAALPPKYEELLRRDHLWLTRAQHTSRGHFNYYAQADAGYDNSTTQYGALGVWESVKRGNRVVPAFWGRLERHMIDS